MSAVTVINSFEVPAGRESEFLELWKKVNAYMQRKPGHLGIANLWKWPEPCFFWPPRPLL